MAFFFKGAVTSSPIKTRRSKAKAVCSNLDLSHLSDSSFECFSTNPLTGSVCSCRRSPRLLANGYYVLTDDSVNTDDEGNVTLTPSHTSVSYKENSVRIFRRRRRRAKRSLVSLLTDVSQSYESWLERSVFRRCNPIPPLMHSSPWKDLDNSFENDIPLSFSYDPTDPVSSPDKMAPQTQIQYDEPQCEHCPTHEQFSQSESGFLDVPPHSTCHHNCYNSSSKSSDRVLLNVILLFLLLCLCIAIPSKFLLTGVSSAVALILLSYIWACKSMRLRRAKTEDITSRNE